MSQSRDANDTLRDGGTFEENTDQPQHEAKANGHDTTLLPWTNMSTWDDGDPAPLDWSITNLVPREQVGLFSGVGGTGKTTTELLKDVAHVTGLPWFNWMPVQGQVIFVGCEDTDKVWRLRLTTIARHF
jgi:RecA-family ATPase